MYESLTKLYYKNQQNYTKVYNQRFNGENTVKLPLQMKAWKGSVHQLFYVNTVEITELIAQIYSKIIENNEIYTTISNGKSSAFIKYYRNEMLVEEIIASNNIEGIRSTRKDLQEAQQSVESNAKAPRFHYIVKKYLHLQQYSEKKLETSFDLRVVYDDFISKEIDKADQLDGETFRKDGVSVLDYRGNVNPVHHGINGESEIVNHINHLFSFMNDGNETPMLIKIAVFQYYFGYIHPFYDGNGRVSRYLISNYLKDINDLLSFKVSKIFLNNINTYYRMFNDTNQELNRGDMTPFITQFLKFIFEGVEEINGELSKYKMLFNNFQLFVSDKNDKYELSEYSRTVLFIVYQSSIYGNELSLADIQRNTKSGYRKVRNAIDDLIAQKLVTRESFNNYSIEEDILDMITSSALNNMEDKTRVD